jgi:hypothetical protein
MAVQGRHKMYTGLSQMSLRPVLTAARVALHQGACSRGIQSGRERDGSQVHYQCWALFFLASLLR